MSVDRLIREEARLIMLQALARQADARLNSELLRAELAAVGLTKSRPWVHEELAYLSDVGAVKTTDAGAFRIAQLTEKGQWHLDRVLAIEGVRRPSLPEH